MINVFIGHNPREAIAFSVLSHSIHTRASVPVSITPLMLSQLNEVLTRERHPLQSTDFSFSRFLTPFLSQYYDRNCEYAEEWFREHEAMLRVAQSGKKLKTSGA